MISIFQKELGTPLLEWVYVNNHCSSGSFGNTAAQLFTLHIFHMAGLAKFQAILEAAAAERAAVEATNADLKAKIAAYKEEIEFLAGSAGEVAESILAAEKAADGAAKAYDDRVAWVNNERSVKR